MPNEINPPEKINGETCNSSITPETKVEIQERLRSKEAKKARDLLAMAMTHFEAMQFVHKQITKQVIKNGK